MKQHTRRRAQRQALMAACLAWAGLYTPATQADPMRPLVPPAPASGPNLAPAAPGSASAPVAAAAVPLRRLLAIRQESNGDRLALFGDRWVSEGQRFMAPEGETLVVKIGATSIELEQARVRTHHYLLAPLLPAMWPARPAELQPGATSPAPSAAGTSAAHNRTTHRTAPLPAQRTGKTLAP